MKEEEEDTLGNFKRTERPSLKSDYFDSFQKKILDEVEPEEKKKNETTVKFEVRYLYFTVGIAAAIALVFFMINNYKGSPEPSVKNEIAIENPVEQEDQLTEYYEYIEENLVDFETEEFIELLAENELISVEEEVNLSDVSSSEVEMYLLEEYDDLESELLEDY